MPNALTRDEAIAPATYEPDLRPEALGLKGAAKDHRLVVAMSGGVDSSLVAALAAKAGYDILGITLQLYDYGAAVQRKGACCAGQDIMDARAVAAKLGIAHYVLNYETRFSEAVIDDFADSYLAGETPIPCVKCNQSVKFSDLLQTARELGAAALLTGHYLLSRQGEHGWQMLQARDEDRDQSYFLFATTQEQLNFLRFPLGGLTKAQTRALADKLNLPVAKKPDSQDICFVPSGDYASVIRKLRPESQLPGELVHVDGRVLGRHDGIINFTIGQRKGLGVAVGEPLFVVRIEPETRRVVVGPRAYLQTTALVLKEVNWLGGGRLEEAIMGARNIYVKVRSTQGPKRAHLAALATGQVCVKLQTPEFGIAPGQACVFYEHGEGAARVLGGGFIERTLGEWHTAEAGSAA